MWTRSKNRIHSNSLIPWYWFSKTLWSRTKSGVIIHLSDALSIKMASISNMPGNFSWSFQWLPSWSASSGLLKGNSSLLPRSLHLLVRTAWMYWDGIAKTSPGLRVTLRQPSSSLLWHLGKVGLKWKLLKLSEYYQTFRRCKNKIKVDWMLKISHIRWQHVRKIWSVFCFLISAEHNLH